MKYIGAAVGKCAQTLGCGKAPDVIRKQLPRLDKNWHKTVYLKTEQRKLAALDSLVSFSSELAQATLEVLCTNQKFITFGGDHSCAIGTWSAVAKHVGEFGLIWIDAHMDAHTPQTSLTGNLHGMPVAVLLGHGDPRLTELLFNQPKIKPENIILIGIRSYEPAEKKLLDKLGVKVYEMDDVLKLGFDTCFKQAVDLFTQRQLKYGISFDLDGLDPSNITASGTLVNDGICLQDVLDSFRELDLDQLIGLEIAEYNPVLDSEDYQDVRVIEDILSCFEGNCSTV